MNRKQLLIVVFGTVALALVVAFMVLPGGSAVVDAAASPDPASGATGLSGGNECYCSPSSDQSTSSKETESTE